MGSNRRALISLLAKLASEDQIRLDVKKLYNSKSQSSNNAKPRALDYTFPQAYNGHLLITEKSYRRKTLIDLGNLLDGKPLPTVRDASFIDKLVYKEKRAMAKDIAGVVSAVTREVVPEFEPMPFINDLVVKSAIELAIAKADLGRLKESWQSFSQLIAELYSTTKRLADLGAFPTDTTVVIQDSSNKKCFVPDVSKNAAVGTHTIDIKALAKNSMMTTMPLDMDISQPVVYDSCTPDSNPGSCFKSGILQINVLDNRITTENTVVARSDSDNVVGLDPKSSFGEGNIYINGKKISIAPGDSLRSIADKLNEIEGVIASIEKDSFKDKYFLQLRSEEHGVQNAIIIRDPHSIFKNRFEPVTTIASVTLNAEDTLADIKDKINAVTAQTDIYAVVQEGRTPTLSLKSKLYGTGNDIKIDNLNNVFGNKVFNTNNGAKITSAKDGLVVIDGYDIAVYDEKVSYNLSEGTLTLWLHSTTTTAVKIEIQKNPEKLHQKIEDFFVNYIKTLQYISQQYHHTANYLNSNNVVDTMCVSGNIITDIAAFNENNFLLERLAPQYALAPAYNSGRLRAFEDMGIEWAEELYDDNGVKPYTKDTIDFSNGFAGLEKSGVLKIDHNKLSSALEKMQDDIKKLLAINFESSTSSLQQSSEMQDDAPFYNLGIKSVDVDIDISRARVLQHISTPLADPDAPIVNPSEDHSNPYTRFTAGTFRLGVKNQDGVPVYKYITLSAGDSLNTVVEKINAAFDVIEVAAIKQEKVGQTSKYRLALHKLLLDGSGIVDHDNVLNNVFNAAKMIMDSSGFKNITDIAVAKNSSRKHLLNSGVFKINGVSIAMPESAKWNNVKDIINNANAGVITSIVPMNNGYFLRLESTDSASAIDGIKIDDPDNVLNGLFSVSQPLSPAIDRFLNTTHVAKIKGKKHNAAQQPLIAKTSYVLTDWRNIHSTGIVKTINWLDNTENSQKFKDILGSLVINCKAPVRSIKGEVKLAKGIAARLKSMLNQIKKYTDSSSKLSVSTTISSMLYCYKEADKKADEQIRREEAAAKHAVVQKYIRDQSMIQLEKIMHSHNK